MRIAVNTRLLIQNRLDGIGWFSYHTLNRITRDHPEVEFIFFFDRPWSEEFVFNSNVTPVKLFPQARHPFLYYLWFGFAVPAGIKKYKADLFLSPDGYLSLPLTIPQVPVIHDINFEHYPKDLPYLTREYYRYYFPKFARKASRIATVSEFSRNDIISNYKIDKDKIDVVYNGVNEIYSPLNDSEKQIIKAKYSNGCPYFLFVGMLHQRKNISGMLKAFEEFKSASPGKEKFILVGHKKWWSDEMETVLQSMKHKNDVIFLGRQPINDLVKITGAAMALLYVSFFEGFGVPIIEAMRCGVPVITSDITSMPEISGDAALLIDPFNATTIKDAMIKLKMDKELQKNLIEKGLQRSRDFSWDISASLLWKTIEKAAGN